MALSFSLHLPAHLLEVLPPPQDTWPVGGNWTALRSQLRGPTSTTRDSFCVCGTSSLAPHQASQAPIGHWGLPLAAQGSRDAGPLHAVPDRALIPYPVPQSHLVSHDWEGSRLVGARAWGKGWPGTSLRGIPGGPAPQEGRLTRGVTSWVQWKRRPGANSCPQAPSSGPQAMLVDMRRHRPAVPTAQRTSLREGLWTPAAPWMVLRCLADHPGLWKPAPLSGIGSGSAAMGSQLPLALTPDAPLVACSCPLALGLDISLTSSPRL